MVWKGGAGRAVMGHKIEGGRMGSQDEAKARGRGELSKTQLDETAVKPMRKRSTYTITNTIKEIKN